MRHSFSPTIRAALAALAAFLVQGCAVVTAPGFDYADPKLKNSVTLGQYIPADADNPPQGVVTPITPALVRAQSQSRPTGVPAGVQSLFGEAKQYTIGPSDVLAIIVYDHPELAPLPGAGLTQSADPTGVAVAPGFRVSDTGEVSFPYAGRIKLAGLTEIEASDLLAKRLARVIKDPQVTVRIQSFRSRRAYVEGEVKTPGTQVFTDIPMTLPEAINRAGGLTPLGDRSFVTLTRGDQTTAINLVQLQESGVNPNRILLQSGDLLSVKSREDSKVFVMGEIIKPSVLNMRNGRMSLNEAMSEAGGPNLNTANLGQIYVVRNNEQGNPLVFHLNARSPIALALADSFALRPRDVVYLDNVPLVSWNRIVNLIIPSGSALLTGRNIVR